MTEQEIISEARCKLEEVTGQMIQITVKKLGRLNFEANNRLKQLVSEETGIPWEIITGKKGNHFVTHARKVYSWIAYYMLEESLEAIGRTLNRHHVTVMYYIDQAKGKMDIEDSFSKDVHFIKNKLIDEFFKSKRA